MHHDCLLPVGGRTSNSICLQIPGPIIWADYLGLHKKGQKFNHDSKNISNTIASVRHSN